MTLCRKWRGEHHFLKPSLKKAAPLLSLEVKSVEYSEQRRQTAQRTHAGEHSDELYLAPAAKLKVMMNRRLLENALALHLHIALGIAYRLAVFVQNRRTVSPQA